MPLQPGRSKKAVSSNISKLRHEGQRAWNNAGCTKECEQCGETFALPPSRMQSKRFCSARCYGLSQRTPGGKLRLSGHWRTVRQRELERRGYECLFCGHVDRTGRTLHVHHINGRKDWDHLSVLCQPCHQWLHRVLKREGIDHNAAA